MIEYYHLFDGIVTSVDPFSDNSLSSLCFSTTDLKNQYLSTKILISTSVCIDLRLVKIFALSLDVDKTRHRFSERNVLARGWTEMCISKLLGLELDSELCFFLHVENNCKNFLSTLAENLK